VTRHRLLSLCTLVGVTMLLASVRPALATDNQYDLYDPEPTFAEWWNDEGLAAQYDNVDGKNWDDKYGVECYDNWLDFNTPYSHYEGGIWSNGDAFSELEIEFTSGYEGHIFGWYPEGTPSQKHVIFSGDDGPGDSWRSIDDTSFPPSGNWGFYYTTSAGTFYSDNAWDAQVFEHPRWNTGYGWVVGWEDQTGRDHTRFEDPNSDDDWSDMGTFAYHNTGYAFEEPDYQDLVITFRRATYGSDGPYTPGDNSPEPGTWILLLATGAVGGLLRRRRKDD